jgi:hypothetical protein
VTRSSPQGPQRGAEHAGIRCLSLCPLCLCGEKIADAWSANGNLTEVKRYNSAGSLVLTVDYSYDAFGKVIQKNDGTVVSRFVQDGWNSNMLPSPLGGEGLGVREPIGNENMNTWAVLSGSNQWQERDVRGDKVDQVLGRIVQAGANFALYPLLDPQQTVRDVIDATGIVGWK